jgi:Chromate transporter
LEKEPNGCWPEVLTVFLRLGLTSFGGPVAHLGYFREELVNRSAGWMTAVTPILSPSASFCQGLLQAKSGLPSVFCAQVKRER